MSKIVKLYIIRHSTSLANALNSMYPASDELMFKCYNAPLAPTGYELIINTRSKKQEYAVDFIMSSPMKRAIQTCLLTYNNVEIKMPIYLVSLLLEFDKYPDCEGTPIKNIMSDPDLLAYKNFDKLNMEYFWNGNPNAHNGFWWDYEFRHDIANRMQKFRELLCEEKFSGKTIAVYTHSGVFGGLFNTNVHNYQGVYVEYDQSKNSFSDVTYI